ncbi:DNA-(apurinic or apyrimidinic site) lyase /endonuclease III [Desulfacinum hydrothermale DSM 13146]|uniref:Endonuclease III n=1 Tax=Desulfacinum hydrothermale DSM 13146 TaxID=1121390 RepID=A0A1W1WZR3_9BACT|nr:endonuclease III [Desulfacinum hydrothermale]SMC16631.1 DNA-(apurinic or apyrimidinic site) lyase /endonuclease III [Desulfacinum hydrothermale DSM 13146]
MRDSAAADKRVEALRRLYPEASLELVFDNPFQLLISVILSAQCTDARVNQVTRVLFSRCPTPQDILALSQEELEEMVRPTGFFRNKAKAVRACCQELVDRYGGRVPGTLEEFVRLPGVGRKTAAMVLGNALGVHEGIAVDTHVKRVSQRLGLSSAKTPEKIEADLMQLLPREDWTWFSNALILHGRRVCKARKPDCQACGLAPWCPYPDQA